MAVSVSVLPKIASAARRARCVPQMSLETVAGVADVDALKQYLRTRPQRGRCAAAAAEAAQRPKAAAYAAAHWAAAPQLVRTTSAASVAAVGTAAWAVRRVRIVDTDHVSAISSTTVAALRHETAFAYADKQLSRLPRTALTDIADNEHPGPQREMLAGHGVCPPAMIAALISHRDTSTRVMAASNPAGIPAGINHCGESAAHPLWPRSVVGSFARDERWRVRSAAAAHLATAATVLDELADDVVAQVRADTASNPNTAPDVLARMFDNADGLVRGALARNPNLSQDLVTGLAGSRHTRLVAVGVALAANPAVDPEPFTNDVSPVVRAAAAARAELDAVTLNRLAEDDNSDVAAAAAANPNCGAVALRSAARKPAARAAAAANPHACRTFIEVLASDHNAEVRAAAASALAVHPKTLARLAVDNDPMVRAAAAAAVTRHHTKQPPCGT